MGIDLGTKEVRIARQKKIREEGEGKKGEYQNSFLQSKNSPGQIQRSGETTEKSSHPHFTKEGEGSKLRKKRFKETSQPRRKKRRILELKGGGGGKNMILYGQNKPPEKGTVSTKKENGLVGGEKKEKLKRERKETRVKKVMSNSSRMGERKGGKTGRSDIGGQEKRKAFKDLVASMNGETTRYQEKRRVEENFHHQVDGHLMLPT